jgi:Plasmid encoded RepA protein
MLRKSKALTKAQRAIVEAGADIRLDRATLEDAAYLARQFVQATLPHSDPKAETWSRQNGNYTLGIQAGFNVKTGKSYGLPYGIIPRLLLFWITTEAVKTKNPRLELGASMAAFMREVGLDPSHGGPRSDARRLQEQMARLFQARISFQQTVQEGDAEGNAWLNMQVSRRGVLWWNPRTPQQDTLWNSWVEIERDFFEAITAAPIPVDTRALKALKRSPLALDLYALLCYEAFRVERSGRARFIPWPGVMTQLGANYQSDDAAKNFKQKARAALRKVAAVMPSLILGDCKDGISILPGSSPAISVRPKVLTKA